MRNPLNAERLPRRKPNAYLLPTLLDRLVDNEPRQQSEAPEAYAVSPERMRAIVQRDLVCLLNSTNLDDVIDPDRYPAVLNSVINYGVPPFSGSFTVQRNWATIQSIITHVIKTYEPRIIPEDLVVRVLNDPQADDHYNVLIFEISGRIHMQPYPMSFMVQSSFDLETRRLTV